MTSLKQVGDPGGGLVAVKYVGAFGHGGPGSALRETGFGARDGVRRTRPLHETGLSGLPTPELGGQERDVLALLRGQVPCTARARRIPPARVPFPREEVHRALLERDGDPEQVGGVLRLAVDAGEDRGTVDLESADGAGSSAW